jgi:phosphatidylethanolamine-binding protein (PEBP) family uncharacterized protein
MSGNRNPHLRWTGVPSTARSLVLLCVDVDVPTRADDVNKEGRIVPADLPRTNFYHWSDGRHRTVSEEIVAGSASDGTTARGKRDPRGPAGSRQGLNDYTLWFAGDSEMSGTVFRVRRPLPTLERCPAASLSLRTLYATDLPRCPDDGAFTGQQVREAIAQHVLAEARLTGTYSLNPNVK